MSRSVRDGEPSAGPLIAAPLTAIRRLSAKETVRARIALAVRLGLLAPGERLPDSAAVALALDVGEVTVRRALTSLCDDGVLCRRRGRTGGTFVADAPTTGTVGTVAAYAADTDRVRRLIDHRVLLECGAAVLAARTADAARIDELRALVDQMSAADGWARFHDLDARFHHLLAACSGVPHAEAELSGVLTELYRYFLPYRMDVLRASNEEHRALVAALAAGEPADAGRIAAHHVQALHHTMFIGLTGPVGT